MARSTTRLNTTTARACRSIRKFSRAGSARRGLSRRSHEGRPRRARPAIRPIAAPDHRPVLPTRRPRRPLALFIHGGYWRSLEPSIFSHMARGLNAHGIAVAVAGYDLCPQVTIGADHRADAHACLFLWQRFGQRLMVYGHSAGGHLAACMVATDWKKLDPKAPADLVPAGYAISGLFDLTPLLQLADQRRLQARRRRGARASRRCSGRSPAGRVFDAVVGGAESSEFLRQSQHRRRRLARERRRDALRGDRRARTTSPCAIR